MSNTTPSKVLIIRLSAMGDVVLTLPIVQQCLSLNPDTEFYILTKKRWRALFQDIEGVRILDIDVEQEYRGVWGLLKLFRLLKNDIQITHIADLHNVLRSKIIRFFAFFSSIKTASVAKNRIARKQLTRFSNKKLHPISNAWERYLAVFKQLGFIVPSTQKYPIRKATQINATQLELLQQHPAQYNIIIAPFAAHKGKIYPFEKMQEVLQKISQHTDINIFILGNGPKEKVQISRWIAALSTPQNVIDISQHFSLQEELDFMSYCDIALVMDSSNLHLAAWVGLPTISIWGATHPFAGFDVWKNNTLIQTDLACRPCSIYGNKPCLRKDYACLNRISPEEIYQTIIEKKVQKAQKMASVVNFRNFVTFKKS